MLAKESFGDTYDQASSASYYRRYLPTRLSIVAYVAQMTRALHHSGLRFSELVDLGCGYGTLGALLRTEFPLEDLYSLEITERLPFERIPTDYRLIGADRSTAALSYARRNGLIDNEIVTDLNQPRLAPQGSASLVTCSAALGYLQPTAVRQALEQLRPTTALITCVTWVVGDLRKAFSGSQYNLTQLTDTPVFQRWATPSEEATMADLLISGAHRAHCFYWSTADTRTETLREAIGALREIRRADQWLAAGRDSAEI